MHVLACKECGKKFIHKDYRIMFCSSECNFNNRYEKVIVDCLECGKEIVYRGTKKRKFCSQSCSATFNNIGVRRHGSKAYANRVCFTCGKVYDGEAETCSRQCGHLRVRKLFIEKWKAGKVSGNRGKKSINLSRQVRDYLLEQAGYSCSVCGYGDVHPVTGNPILQINHIDGDHTNSVPENLEVLCYNCHAKTPTFGSLNKKKGRRKVIKELEERTQ